VSDGVLILWIWVLGVLNTSSGNDTNPADSTTEVDPDEHGSTTDFVNEARSDTGDDDLDNIHGDEKVGLGDFISETGSCENTIQEV